MTKQASERERFVATMAREAPGFRVDDLAELMRLARRHGRLQERACNGHQKPNGDWDEAAAKRDELADERLEARIRKMVEAVGCQVEFSGDPRGSTVKVIVPSGYSDSWGGVGICVPQ